MMRDTLKLISINYIPFVAFILWFSWYGFNCGSALSITGPNQAQIVSLVAVNTTLAAASACVASCELS